MGSKAPTPPPSNPDKPAQPPPKAGDYYLSFGWFDGHQLKNHNPDELRSLLKSLTEEADAIAEYLESL